MLANFFVIDEADVRVINDIIAYGKTKEGREDIARIRAKGELPGQIHQGEEEDTGPVVPAIPDAGVPEVPEGEAEYDEEVDEDRDYPEHLEGEVEEEAGPTAEDFPEAWAKTGELPGNKPTKKGPKKAIAQTEAKLANVTSDIKAGDRSEAKLNEHARLTHQREELVMKRYEGEQTPGVPFAEPPLGAPTRKPKIGRIQISPIYGGKVKLLKDIIIDLSKGIPSKIFFTKRPN